MMQIESKSKVKKGRRPIGSSAMTVAERQRRHRDLLRTQGGKQYLLCLNGLHQEKVEELAQSNGLSVTKVLQGLVEAALDRYVGVMSRSERLLLMGASNEEIQAFIHAHLFPDLPDIESLEICHSDKR